MIQKFCQNPVGGLALISLVGVMGFFTWSFHGMTKNLDLMTRTMITVAEDLDTMAKTQTVMAANVAAMNGNTSVMAQRMTMMTGQVQAMNGQFSRLNYDINRGTRAFTSPMGFVGSMMGMQ